MKKALQKEKMLPYKKSVKPIRKVDVATINNPGPGTEKGTEKKHKKLCLA